MIGYRVRLFGPSRGKVNITAVKSMAGHMLGGAGGLGAMAAIMAIHRGVVSPTINLENPDPKCLENPRRSAGPDRVVGFDQQGPQETRIPVRRVYHHVCLHAVGGPGE